MRFFQRSLAVKISLAIILLESMILSGFGYYFIDRFSERVDQHLHIQANIPGKLMQGGVLRYTAVHDLGAIKHLVQQDILHAVVLQPSGKIFYASKRDLEDRSIYDSSDILFEFILGNTQSEIQTTVQGNMTILDCLTPLFSDTKLIGYLYLSIDTSLAAQEKWALTKQYIVLTLLCILLTSVLEILIIHYLVNPRIRASVECLQLVEGGDLNARLATTTNKDEIGVLQRGINAMVREIQERTVKMENVQKELRLSEANLEENVRLRTLELTAVNKELEAFSYSVSHDLRAPLRSMDGFSLALLEDYEDKLDDQGKDYLQRVRDASKRMGHLIDSVLELSRMTRNEMNRESVDLSSLVKTIITDLQESQPERQVEFVVEPGVVCEGDVRLLGTALENLLGNAFKFTGKNTETTIEFGLLPSSVSEDTKRDGPVYFIKDNGAGFDMNYVEKLFGVFQRLHGANDYPGNGVGLASVERIIHRHGGRVWAEGEVNKGATFYFTIGRSSAT